MSFLEMQDLAALAVQADLCVLLAILEAGAVAGLLGMLFIKRGGS